MFFYSREALVIIYNDTKTICANIPVPNSKKGTTTIPLANLVQKRGTIIVEPLDTVSALVKYSALGKTAVLNMANAKHKGGGVERGAMAQEECLFRCSNLFTIPDDLYPMATNELIYTQGATFVKDFHYIKMQHVQADVITIAAPNLNKNHQGNIIDQEMLSSYDAIMSYKIAALLDSAALNQCKNIILGAWGCGAFKNDPNVVAELFNRVLKNKRYLFERVIFAVINDGNSVGNNYQIFFDKFGQVYGERAEIGDTIKTKSGVEFEVKSQEIDKFGAQWVWSISDKEWDIDELHFSPSSYGVPNQNFTIIKRI